VYTAEGATLVTPEDGSYEVRLDAAHGVNTVVVAAAETVDGGDGDATLTEFARAGTAVERLRL